MSSKNKFFVKSDVDPNSTVNEAIGPIAEGKRWIIRSFNAADIKGESGGSYYILKYGGKTKSFISVKNSTYRDEIVEEITGDGVKTISIEMRNCSSEVKTLVCWIKASERG